MAEALLEAIDLQRRFGTLTAVKGISLQAHAGEVLGLLGPNGAGKSTTLQMLAGILAPTAGSVRVAGIDVMRAPSAAKANLGYLPDHPPLYRELSVDEYLTHCARLRRIGKDSRRAAIADAKRRCGLESVGHRLIGQLSKGYGQRVGIAQAILHQPDVVILDEPTVGLDPLQVQQLRELIADLRHEHCVVLSTHILSEVQAVCDRVVVLNEGRIAAERQLTGAQGEDAGVVVALRDPPPLAQIEQFAFVRHATRLSAERFRLVLATPADAELFVEEAVARNWRLYHLSQAQPSLEQMFLAAVAETPLAAAEGGA